MWDRVVKLLFLVAIWASESTQRKSRSKLVFHDVKDVFFRNPEKSSLLNAHPFTRTLKTIIRGKYKASGWITKCRGLECVSTVSSSTANNFLNKALNVLDKYDKKDRDKKKNDYKEISSLARVLATSDVDETSLKKDDNDDTDGKLTKKSHGKIDTHSYTGIKRQNWFGLPHSHNILGPHLPNQHTPPIHVMDPFYNHNNGGNVGTHQAHPFHFMHPGVYHENLAHHMNPPFALHHHHPMSLYKPHGYSDGPIPPYPDPLLSGPPHNAEPNFQPYRLLPGQPHNAGPNFSGQHVAEPPAILPGILHNAANGMTYPPLRPNFPGENIAEPPAILPGILHNAENGMIYPPIRPPAEIRKVPFPVPYPVPSPPSIKEVPVPIRIPVRGPSIIQKYYYPVRFPQPSQIHHVPYPIYIRQPPSYKPYFIRVASPPQRIPVPVPSPPKIFVQRVPYPVVVPRPVHVIHHQQMYSVDSGHCKTNPCINGGTCSAFKDYYRCHCQVGYKGAHCEEQSKCHPNPCRNLGFCTEVEKDYECTCQPGYKGMNCEMPDPCTPSPCKNSGKCGQVGNSYNCQCKIGWIGKNCGMEAKCLPINPCQNAGICTEALGTYHCNCPSSWQGLNCEISASSMQPVTNHFITTGGCGGCHPKAFCNQDRCVCDPGYIGDGYNCDVMQQHTMVSMKSSFMAPGLPSDKRKQVPKQSSSKKRLNKTVPYHQLY